ncbi:hypothetical protein CGLO_03341 [Colletotrichum gloeosporioides Cg-14]|uniref:CHRD domain-containing protein n=1 Tax=Colletotrichum gloeosporioides (strain Cg-14) TaxID=1237896 RepID=T0KWU5_COLGC|nr:hypothetical protein CGLO_03341 [Colletotrichum gloeosporioides Cg-14]
MHPISILVALLVACASATAQDLPFIPLPTPTGYSTQTTTITPTPKLALAPTSLVTVTITNGDTMGPAADAHVHGSFDNINKLRDIAVDDAGSGA